jgi:hypothetical protein
MASEITAYHLTVDELFTSRSPPNFDTEAELQLGRGPPRADFLLLRREGSSHRRDSQGQVLRFLWPLLPRFTVVEYKSPGRRLSPGNAAHLLGYAGFFHSLRHARGVRSDIAVVFLLARITPGADEDLARLGWSRRPLRSGYYELSSSPYRGFVVDAQEVAEAEDDELLALVSESKMTIKTDEGFRWFRSHILQHPKADEMQRLEGYDKVVEKALARLSPAARLKGLKPEERVAGLKAEERVAGLKAEERVAGLKAEERVAGLKAEERVAGLSPEERLAGLKPELQVLALSDEVLRQLSPKYLRSLPATVQRKIQRRLKSH